MDDIKRAVVEIVQMIICSDETQLRIRNNAAAIAVEANPLSALQTTIRVKPATNTPARYFTVQVKENL